MSYYDNLRGQIERFERINEDDEYYDEKDRSNYYDKKDVLEAIRKYGDELEGEKNQVITEFIMAIGNYIKDEEVLTELFMRNGKRTLDVISNETDLLTKEETKILIYRCAISASSRNMETLQQKLDEERVWQEEVKKKRDRALRSRFSTKEEKQAELSELIFEDGKLEELLEKARLWDEMQKQESKQSEYEEELVDNNSQSEYGDELYEDESETDLYDNY